VRILGLPLPEAEAHDPIAVMRHVHERVLSPILRGAVEKGLLRTIPTVDQILETAHVLPAKPNTAAPIICRFFSRNTRALIFRLKKEYADRLLGTTGNSQHSRGNGKLRYPIYEDLTRTNFFKMRAIAQHEAVHSCWSVSGSLRFKLNGENRIRKVKNILDSVDKIIENS